MGSYCSVLNNTPEGAYCYCQYTVAGSPLLDPSFYQLAAQFVPGGYDPNSPPGIVTSKFGNHNTQLNLTSGRSVDFVYLLQISNVNSWQEACDFFNAQIGVHLLEYGLGLRRPGESYVSEKRSLSLVEGFYCIKLLIVQDGANGWVIKCIRGYMTTYTRATDKATKDYGMKDCSWGLDAPR